MTMVNNIGGGTLSAALVADKALAPVRVQSATDSGTNADLSASVAAYFSLPGFNACPLSSFVVLSSPLLSTPLLSSPLHSSPLLSAPLRSSPLLSGASELTITSSLYTPATCIMSLCHQSIIPSSHHAIVSYSHGHSSN